MAGMRDPVGDKLLEIRDRDGLTTAAMARLIGVDGSYLHLVFRGERRVGRKMLDGALVAFPEVGVFHARLLTISNDSVDDQHGEVA